MPKAPIELQRQLQDFFQDGLTVVIGSGLSTSEGIPGMGALQSFLIESVPSKVSPAELGAWEAIKAHLSSGKGLETALLLSPPTEALEEAIVRLTVDLIEPAERSVLAAVIAGTRTLALSKLLPHANPQPNQPLHVVTTNYDRLAEAAAEVIGWAADTQFIGQCVGTINAAQSQLSLAKAILGGRNPRIERRQHIQLSKPHGSLDWFRGPNGPLRTSISLDLPRLLITPGRNKYRKGYDTPFDLHREKANSAIDRAARLLIIGYGFNDDHLETHLRPRLQAGIPCRSLTRTLTENAVRAISESAGMVALSEDPENVADGFLCTQKSGCSRYDGGPLWQLAAFTNQILNS